MAASAREPTEAQRNAWDAAKEHAASMPIRPNMKVHYIEKGHASVGVAGHEDSGWLLYSAIGSRASGFVDSKTLQLMNLARRGDECKSEHLNEALAFVAAVEPRNEVESALAMQMYGAQQLAYEMMMHAKSAQMIPQLEAYGALANKFMRTSAALTETLMKLRRGGEQVIKHIHLDNRGGQAIVADAVNYGGAGNEKGGEQPYGAAGAAFIGGAPALRSPDPLGHGVPISRDAERAVPIARGQESGSPQGQSERL